MKRQRRRLAFFKKLVLSPAFPFLMYLSGFGSGYITDIIPKLPPATKGLAPILNRLANHSVIQPLANPLPLPGNQIQVCFTPNKRCQQLILDHIRSAQGSIHVQSYSFTDKHIAQALGTAAQRGVRVKVILDKSHRTNPNSVKKYLHSYSIPLRYDAPAGIAHNKIIIIDNRTVLTGSYNYSAGAYQRNTENLLVINNSELASQYLENWQKRWDLSSSAVNDNTISTLRKRQKRPVGVSN